MTARKVCPSQRARSCGRSLKVKDRDGVPVIPKVCVLRALDGRLKPRLIGLIVVGKRAGHAADQTEPVAKLAATASAL